MAQRRIFRPLATTNLPRLAINLAQAKKARSIPVGSGDRTGNDGEAAIAAAVPQKAIIHDCHVVGGALPFSHQDTAGAWKHSRRSRWHLGTIATEHLIKQSSQFFGDRLSKATQTALLSRVGDAKRNYVTTQRRRRLLAKLLNPECPERAAGQAIKIMDINCTGAFVHSC